MTDERMALQDLLEKTPDADFLRRMIGFAAQRLMELDIESRTGAAHAVRASRQRGDLPRRRTVDRVLPAQPDAVADRLGARSGPARAGRRRFYNHRANRKK